MSSLAPQWAFAAQAIHSAGDQHLAKGVHLKLMISHGLGLPAFPFQVYRLRLGELAKEHARRRDIVWIDSRGNTLTPPFNVVPDNPVTGWLPGPHLANCCWIRVEAQPTVGSNIVGGPLPGTTFREISRPNLNLISPLLSAGAIRFPIERLLPVSQGLRVDAVVSTPRGPGIVGSRTEPLYILAASRIDRVVVTGRGVVRGAVWIDSNDLKRQVTRWRLLALPIQSGLRYNGIVNADDEAMQRVKRGAPLLEALMDAPTVANAASAPVIPTPEPTELTRVDKRRPPVMNYLQQLINRTPGPARDLTSLESVRNERGVNVGTVDVNLLGAVLSTSADPGFSRLLGFGDVDETMATAPPREVIAYVIEGWWDKNETRFPFPLDRMIPPDALISRDKGPAPPPESVKEGLYNFFVVACATIGIAPALPARPTLGVPVPGPWLPVQPPAPVSDQREISIPAASLKPGAMIAFARRRAGVFEALNEKAPDGRNFPATPSVPSSATDVSQGVFYDREAPPPVTRYRLAQSDWFGRWSNWSEVDAPAGVRPRPPRPDPAMFYTPPAFSVSPIPNGPLSGLVRIRVPVPAARSTAPGSLPLQTLRMVLNGTSSDRPLTAAPGTDFEIVVVGPPLARCQQGELKLTARWIDSAGAISEPSNEITRAISDPRPPEQVMIPATLAYGSRPDATGKSRIDLRWTATPTQRRFRIFHSDETTLRTQLERIVARDQPDKPTAQAILTAVGATSTPQDRAAVYVANKAFLKRTMFELLTHDPISVSSFVHQVSGALRVLVFYRVVAVSDGNVEADFAAAEMIPFGIPNSGAPAMPVIEVKPDLATANTATIKIKVPLGTVPAVEYRLRRSLSKASDPLGMPVVSTGSVPALSLTPLPEGAINNQAQTVDVTDSGSSEIQPGGTLRSWTIYSWRAEVRGGTEPGSTLPGEWSLASLPASVAFIPPNPPAPATNLEYVLIGAGAEVRCQHSEPLIGGSMGSYSVDLYKREPGKSEVFVAAIAGDAPAPAGRGADNKFHFSLSAPALTGTVFRVIVMDPMGRTSPPSVSVVAP